MSGTEQRRVAVEALVEFGPSARELVGEVVGVHAAVGLEGLE